MVFWKRTLASGRRR